MSDDIYLHRRLPHRYVPSSDPKDYIFNGSVKGQYSHRFMCIADAITGLIPREPCTYCFSEQHSTYGSTADWPERWLDDAAMAELFPDLNGSFDFYQRGERVVNTARIPFCVDDVDYRYTCWPCFKWQHNRPENKDDFDTDWAARWMEV